MKPHTATSLRESKRNVLKDFVSVAGPLGVSHFLMLSATEHASYLRVAKVPRGPTLTCRIHEYSRISDVQRAQRKPRFPPAGWFRCSVAAASLRPTPSRPPAHGFHALLHLSSPVICPSPPCAPAAFLHGPLLVMNNFGQAEHMKLATVLFQNLFPPINVQTVRLSMCQRVVLLNYDKDTNRIQVPRHPHRHADQCVLPCTVVVAAVPTYATKSMPGHSQLFPYSTPCALLRLDLPQPCVARSSGTISSVSSQLASPSRSGGFCSSARSPTSATSTTSRSSSRGGPSPATTQRWGATWAALGQNGVRKPFCERHAGCLHRFPH